MKTFLLLICIALGIMIPQAHVLSFLIQYNLMALLLFAFLSLTLDRKIIRKNHFYILAANIAIPFLFYFLFKKFDSNLALAAFITGISPTAVSAPAVIYQLKGKVEFTTFAVLLNNLAISIIIPFLLPLVIDAKVEINTGSVLLPVIMVIGVPFLLVQLIRKFTPRLEKKLIQWQEAAYYILLFTLFLATAKATRFISADYEGPKLIVYLIALSSLIICLFSFFVGSRLGGKELKQEAMQSLGQKNNSLTVWIALTFINPLTALGPVFYILYHNIIISIQLYLHGKGLKS